MARLSDAEIDERLVGLEGWERSGEAIAKQFDNGDFKGSVDFVIRLTPEAEDPAKLLRSVAAAEARPQAEAVASGAIFIAALMAMSDQ
jgi:hypothetical protein